MGLIQSLITYAVHRIWKIPPCQLIRGLHHNVQHDNRSHILRSLHCTLDGLSSTCRLSKKAIRRKGKIVNIWINEFLFIVLYTFPTSNSSKSNQYCHDQNNKQCQDWMKSKDCLITICFNVKRSIFGILKVSLQVHHQFKWFGVHENAYVLSVFQNLNNFVNWKSKSKLCNFEAWDQNPVAYWKMYSLSKPDPFSNRDTAIYTTSYG